MRLSPIGLSVLLMSACDGNSGKRGTNPFHLPPEEFIGDVKKGAVLYQRNCLCCHGNAGSGSNQGPPLVHKTYNSSYHTDVAFHSES